MRKSIGFALLIVALFVTTSFGQEDKKANKEEWLNSAMRAFEQVLLEEGVVNSRNKVKAQEACAKDAQSYEEKVRCYIPEAFKKDPSLLVKYPLP